MSYDTAVKANLPQELEIKFQRQSDLRYGENPNQPAAQYAFADVIDIRLAKTGKDGVSATNYMDVARGMDVLKFFNVPAVSVMKHLLPSGFARQHKGNSLDKIYTNARDADARSAFGSVVVLNRPLDMATAEAIYNSFVEGVAAPDYEKGTMAILERKDDLRVMVHSGMERMPKYVGDDTKGLYDIKILPGGKAIVQMPYLTSIRSEKNLIIDPSVRTLDGITSVTDKDLEDMTSEKSNFYRFVCWDMLIWTASL